MFLKSYDQKRDPRKIEKIKNAKYRKGQIVEIWGIAEKRQKVEAWFSSLIPPGITWKYNIRLTSGVNNNRIKRNYLVDGIITNAAKQPIRRLMVSVRVYQPGYRISGNAAKQSGVTNNLYRTFILENIQPRRSKPFALPFELIDIASLAVGQNTRPIVEINIVDYEL